MRAAAFMPLVRRERVSSEDGGPGEGGMSMSQRLSGQDASFLYTESASGPMHISSVYVLRGELSHEDAFAHFAERIHLVPAYR